MTTCGLRPPRVGIRKFEKIVLQYRNRANAHPHWTCARTRQGMCVGTHARTLDAHGKKVCILEIAIAISMDHSSAFRGTFGTAAARERRPSKLQTPEYQRRTGRALVRSVSVWSPTVVAVTRLVVPRDLRQELLRRLLVKTHTRNFVANHAED